MEVLKTWGSNIQELMRQLQVVARKICKVTSYQEVLEGFSVLGSAAEQHKGIRLECFGERML